MDGKRKTYNHKNTYGRKKNAYVYEVYSMFYLQPGRTTTQDGQKLEISFIGRRGIVLSM